MASFNIAQLVQARLEQHRADTLYQRLYDITLSHAFELLAAEAAPALAKELKAKIQAEIGKG